MIREKGIFDVLTVNEVPVEDTHAVRLLELNTSKTFLENEILNQITNRESQNFNIENTLNATITALETDTPEEIAALADAMLNNMNNNIGIIQLLTNLKQEAISGQNTLIQNLNNEIIRATNAENHNYNTLINKRNNSQIDNLTNQLINIPKIDNTLTLANKIQSSIQNDAQFQADLSAEISRAIQRENQLYNSIVDDDSQINTINDNLQNEILRATSKELELSTALDNESVIRQTHDNEHWTLIYNENERAQSSESELSSEIVHEIDRAISNELIISDNLSSEINRAISKETDLNSMLDILVNRDFTSVQQEIDRAISKETDLQNNKLNRGGDMTTGHYKFDSIKLSGNDDYIYTILDKWRIKETFLGYYFIFEYNQGIDDWKQAVVFDVTHLVQKFFIKQIYSVILTNTALTSDNSFAISNDGNVVAKNNCSVDITPDGKTMIVGEYLYSSIVYQKGRAIIYKYEDEHWIETAVIQPTDVDNYDRFGYKVSISADGNRVAMSAIGYDTNLRNIGIVYIYDYHNDEWQFNTKLIPAETNAYSYVGLRMKMSKNGLAVIASSYYSNTNNRFLSGAAFLFREINGVWSNQQKLSDPNAALFDLYGNDIDISDDGTIILIGIKNDDDNYYNSGSVYVYEIDKEPVKLYSSNSSAFSYFGSNVAINGDGNLLAISSQDSVYIYYHDMNNWVQYNELLQTTSHLIFNKDGKFLLCNNNNQLFTYAIDYELLV